MIETVPTGRNQRLRRSPAVVQAHHSLKLPALSTSQQQLLHDWLRSSEATQRQWQSLLDLAGIHRLDIAKDLAELLCAAGWVILKEKHAQHQWSISHLSWIDLPAAQARLGIASQAERQNHKQHLHTQLQQLVQEYLWLSSATQHLLASNLPAATLSSRSQLLQALVNWHSEQRNGLRQDFALAARQDTKGISSSEWDWLAEHLDLENLGIERFAPILWLAGAISIQNPKHLSSCSPQGLSFIGLPIRQLRAPWQVSLAPQRYWLIENRASFERQATQLEKGVCLIWLPGRPSHSWQEAIAWLLTQAPAPADISCDPDPAGIDIALTAGRIWEKYDLSWQPHRMGAQECLAAQTKVLNTYDQARLKQLVQKADLPQSLHELCLHMLKTQAKSEQEGWL
jgi:hypothetical protein